jgi:glutamate carboxypeptidase
MDTVHKLGSFDPILREDDLYLYGPGAGDCKGGIVLALLTAATLKKIGYTKRPIKLLFAADEESGGPTGQSFYPRELAGADYMFNAESGINEKLVTGRKASLIAEYHIQGKAEHVGYLSGKPKSAIREAALKLLELEDASDYDNLTFSGGVISGGTVATSVPESCSLQVNIRIKDSIFVPKAIATLEHAVKSHVEGTQSTLNIRGNRVPMSQREGNVSLCKRMNDVSLSLGFGELTSVFVGGASDAAYASAMNIPVVCASGPIVDYQHTLNERVLKSSLAQRAKIHALTILEL